MYFYQSYRKNKSGVPFILDHPTYINTLGTPSKDSVCYASYITDEVFTKCTEAIYTKWLLHIAIFPTRLILILRYQGNIGFRRGSIIHSWTSITRSLSCWNHRTIWFSLKTIPGPLSLLITHKYFIYWLAPFFELFWCVLLVHLVPHE